MIVLFPSLIMTLCPYKAVVFILGFRTVTVRKLMDELLVVKSPQIQMYFDST